MNILIHPRKLQGRVQAIPSKSQAHRALICAALAKGETEVVCPQLSKDIRATAECLRAMGAGVEYKDGSIHVRPIVMDGESLTERDSVITLDCGESGSTLRFLLPTVCALGLPAAFLMRGRLPQRPLSPLWELLEENGCSLRREGAAGEILRVSGKLQPGNYEIAGNVSSQFISGLLFACCCMQKPGRVVIKGKTESAGYIAMTLKALRDFGAEPAYEALEQAFAFPGRACLRSPGRIVVEGDWSNAAFWLTAEALGSRVEVTGLAGDSPQGDRAAVECLKRISSGSTVIDASDIPDLVPALAVAAALSPGTVQFVHAERLRIKESDRLKSVCSMLQALGGACRETEDGLIVEGKKELEGGIVDGANDHRIVMSAAVAATACRGPVTILGAQAAEKSYPDFWKDYTQLGGKTEVI